MLDPRRKANAISLATADFHTFDDSDEVEIDVIVELS